MQGLSRKKFLKIGLITNLALCMQPLNALYAATKKTFDSIASNDNVTYYKKGEVEYELLRQGFNKRINKYPLIIALCKNTNGVAEAVKYAISLNLPIAIKSGGHCMEGFSCNNDGIVINLSSLTEIDWTNKETIAVGPGATLSNIYDAILPKGRIIPGGSCAGVGIGGLTLGGGYGLLARKFGLTCDSLQEVTMVDGTGNIVKSSAENDLLWACKGGGNGNFGIVTKLVFKTHHAPKTLQSFRFRCYNLNAQRAKSILQKWFEVNATLPIGCFSAFVLNGKSLYILLTNCDKNSKEVENIVNELSIISDKTTKTKAQPIKSALKVFYGRQHPLLFKNASAGLYKNFDEIEHFIEKVLEVVVKTRGMIYQVNTLGGNIQNEKFENLSSFPHRTFSYFSELQTYWERPTQESFLLERFEQVQQLFQTNNITAQYRNYPDINFKDSSFAYYGNNIERLKLVKQKFDPNNFIRHEQSIGP
jgi:FAD binding domain/Berberine and berberine like